MRGSVLSATPSVCGYGHVVSPAAPKFLYLAGVRMGLDSPQGPLKMCVSADHLQVKKHSSDTYSVEILHQLLQREK